MFAVVDVRTKVHVAVPSAPAVSDAQVDELVDVPVGETEKVAGPVGVTLVPLLVSCTVIVQFEFWLPLPIVNDDDAQVIAVEVVPLIVMLCATDVAAW